MIRDRFEPESGRITRLMNVVVRTELPDGATDHDVYIAEQATLEDIAYALQVDPQRLRQWVTLENQARLTAKYANELASVVLAAKEATNAP